MMLDEYTIYKYGGKNQEREFLKYRFDNSISYDFELLKKKILFFLVSRGRYKICCVKNSDGELMHYSFIVPYCRKFSFMNKEDVVIGPCWTNEKFRGKGIYANALDYIAMQVRQKNPQSNVYVLVREKNIQSTKGIQKSGFNPVGKIQKTKVLKLYRNASWF